MENRSFFKPITIKEIVIFMIKVVIQTKTNMLAKVKHTKMEYDLIFLFNILLFGTFYYTYLLYSNR